ncbi:MAG: bifunctional isocitrate dehydrogenase kinase/phosphatase [Chthoniobacterales bacterium]|nr:MAG: bifunctional isocitrate dehydrogenase kinase/phosphatase [Chthoniobacterales bacterium]
MSETVSAAAPGLTDSRLAALCAEAARDAFSEYEARFDEITSRARSRFLTRDWHGGFDDSRERLRLYSLILDSLTNRVRELMAARACDRSIWSATKAAFSALIAQSQRWEIAESFFNSLTRRVFATEGVNQAIEFVDTDFDAQTGEISEITHRYSGATAPELILRLLTDETVAGFSGDRWINLREAAEAAALRLSMTREIEVVRAIFYRGRGAYIVGRAWTEGRETPIAFCLLHSDERGITLDALLIGEADLAILFSYTRAYFRVNAPSPFLLVRWLRDLMQGKRLADLYNALGYNRHAKTEFYRDFIRHLQNSRDCFVDAEGTRGMVMIVFTLPSYDVVFKLIRDRFDQPKESDRSDVMQRYKLVFEHDRAGRLIEAHEFEHLRIPRARFERSLLEELLRNASGTVRLEGDDVIIGHAYVERRVRPLNLFFAESNDEAAIDAACDYGNAIKDLAASNIFPGDLLTKNFGLTRRGRVVFYDYDELCFLIDCNFRELPQSRSYEEEMSAEPWFSVRENDIFPEEFPRFLAFPKRARDELMKRHGDLFHPEFWQSTQRKLRAGELPEVFPYAEQRRLGRS